MDDLLREFITETHENIDVIDVELVRFEQEPNNAKILGKIFRLVHTIKGTCGFLNLPRLEALTHAAESLIGNFRDGAPVTSEAVTLILATIDRIKLSLDELERTQAEQQGDDQDLIVELQHAATQAFSGAAPAAGGAVTSSTPKPQTPKPPPQARDVPTDKPSPAPGPAAAAASVAEKAAAIAAKNARKANARSGEDAGEAPAREEERSDSRIAAQSIRVHVDTLEQLMTMVSELVLTRNQLLEIGRRHEESEFKAPLQRLSNVTAELQEGVMKTRMQPIGNAWQKLPRIVRDLSNELGKPIEFEMHGAETELDRQVLDMIKDPLTHMVRNSADHGLETPAERRAAGK